jgi:multiple sugar transport system ATP-binding protein
MARVRLEKLGKRFPGGVLALDHIDLEIGDGEIVVLVGPSGCGKSTAMRLVAGLDAPSAGAVFIGERDVTRLPPQERDVAMVFQSYALYPHKTVRENLAFGLRVRGAAKPDIDRRVDEVAATLELTPLLARKPRELSGGQRQRVALGRAIARSPQLFLLDEPLSNLDAQLRVQTRTELARLQRRLDATMLYVTHDQEEAMTLGDRVAVMRAGRIEQVGPPLEIYERPANVFVAGFVGSPAMNLVPRDGHILGIRPQDVELVAAGQGDAQGRVDVVEALGRDLLCHVKTEQGEVALLAAPDAPVREGDPVGLRFRPGRVHRFDATSGVRLA